MSLLRRYRVVDAYNTGIDKLVVQIDPVTDFNAEAFVPIGVDGMPITDDYTLAFEYDANNHPVYEGRAVPGTTKDTVGWQIKKFTYDGAGNLTDVQYADGSRGFDQVWNSRASLAYS